MSRNLYALDRLPAQAGELEPDATFERWYHDYHPRLRSYCARLLGEDAAAEDIAQETLFRAWVRRADLRSEPEVRAWLWRVARNLCVDTARSRARLTVVDSVPESPDPDTDPAMPLEAEEERAEVRRALAALSQREQEVLHLREVRGMDYEELASRLGVSAVGARSVLFRARRSLRHALEAASGGFAAFVPAMRRGWLTMRRGAEHTVGRVHWQNLPVEIAAGMLAAATIAGATAAAPGGPVPGRTVTAAINAPQPVNVTVPGVGGASANVTSHGGIPTGAKTSAATPVKEFHTDLTIGQRQGDPNQTLVDTQIGMDPTLVPSQLHPVDMDVLPRSGR